MKKESLNGRLRWLDAAKGFALLLVLFSHSMRDEMRLASGALDLLYRLCYCFEMPFFFWLTGYTYILGRKGRARPEALLKRTKRQFLPWAAYTLLIYAVFALASRIDPLRRVLDGAGYALMPLGRYLLLALQANNPWAYHLWFILVLFAVTGIVTLLDLLLGEHPRLLCALVAALGCAVCLVQERLSLGEWWRIVNYLALYLPWFAFGMLAALSWERLSRLPGAALYAWAGLGLVYAVARAAFFSGFSGNSLEVENTALRMALHFLSYPFLAGLMTGVCLWLAGMASGQPARIREGLAFLGKNSFPVYLFHQPFCCAFLGTLLYGKLHLPALATMAVCLSASLLAPFALIWACRRLFRRNYDSK